MTKALVLHEQSTALLPMEEIRRQIAKCVHVDEAKEIRDKAKAIETFRRESKASLDVQNDAIEFRVRAERRIGQLLAETPKAKGAARTGIGRRGERGSDAAPHSDAPTLADLSITKKQSARWQKVAAVPEPEFERRIATAKGSGEELTTAKMLHAPTPTPRPARQTESNYDLSTPNKRLAAISAVIARFEALVKHWPAEADLSIVVHEVTSFANYVAREKERRNA